MKLKFFVLLLLSLYIVNCTLTIEAQATIRYVSKTGSSQPPYTSWLTAADNIQKCINICSFGDTVYVANGIYQERIDMIPGLALIGAGMDSCVINSSQVTPPITYSVRVTDSCYLAGFQIMPYIDDTQGHGIYIYDVNIENIYAVVEKNKIINAKYGIDISSSSLGTDYLFKLIRMNVVLNVGQGINCDQTAPIIQGNIVYAKSNGLMSGIISAPAYLDNIVVLENAPNGSSGFGGGFDLISIVKNNLFISLDGSGESGIASYTDSLNNNIVSGA